MFLAGGARQIANTKRGKCRYRIDAWVHRKHWYCVPELAKATASYFERIYFDELVEEGLEGSEGGKGDSVENDGMEVDAREGV